MTEEKKIYENNEKKNNFTKTVLIFAIILFVKIHLQNIIIFKLLPHFISIFTSTILLH